LVCQLYHYKDNDLYNHFQRLLTRISIISDAPVAEGVLYLGGRLAHGGQLVEQFHP
jgi:hypothetical protein